MSTRQPFPSSSRRAAPWSSLIAGEPRLVAVEDAARYRDALGIPLPPGLPQSLLETVPDPLAEPAPPLCAHARPLSRVRCRRRGLASRLPSSMPRSPASSAPDASSKARSVLAGAAASGATSKCCASSDGDRWRKLRQEVEPVEAAVLGRFLTSWHGIGSTRAGLDGLLDAIEQLQGVPLVASLLEFDILPSRVADYTPAQLDTLMAAGEVVWVGVEPLGRSRRTHRALSDRSSGAALATGAARRRRSQDASAEVLAQLQQLGASFFAPLHASLGGGFPQETVDALWSLVWKGR